MTSLLRLTNSNKILLRLFPLFTILAIRKKKWGVHTPIVVFQTLIFTVDRVEIFLQSFFEITASSINLKGSCRGVYKLGYRSCNGVYVDQTDQARSIRLEQHLSSGKKKRKRSEDSPHCYAFADDPIISGHRPDEDSVVTKEKEIDSIDG